MHQSSKLSISKLCNIAKVAKSSFYRWVNKENSELDIEIEELVKQIYWANNGELGYRRVTMELRRKFNLIVNHKKVLRIMQELGLSSKIRKTKKHAVAQRKNENWTLAENLLKSNFNASEPNTIFSTDVTYLILKNGKRYYLSVIKDLASGEISGYSLSDRHNIELILDTISQIQPNKKGCIIHSDRGALYSSFQYIQKLKQLGIKRSMSEAGKPTQNAPVESFFGHFKDEVNYKRCNNFEELKDKVDRYVYYYNTSRYQWNRNMLTPIEVREHLFAYNYCPF